MRAELVRPSPGFGARKWGLGGPGGPGAHPRLQYCGLPAGGSGLSGKPQVGCPTLVYAPGVGDGGTSATCSQHLPGRHDDPPSTPA